MKVRELIAFLDTLHPELEVVLPGYEGGYKSVTGFTDAQEYVKDYNEQWYYGPHEQLNYLTEYEYLTMKQAVDKGIFKGVMIY